MSKIKNLISAVGKYFEERSAQAEFDRFQSLRKAAVSVTGAVHERLERIYELVVEGHNIAHYAVDDNSDEIIENLKEYYDEAISGVRDLLEENAKSLNDLQRLVFPKEPEKLELYIKDKRLELAKWERHIKREEKQLANTRLRFEPASA